MERVESWLYVRLERARDAMVDELLANVAGAAPPEAIGAAATPAPRRVERRGVRVEPAAPGHRPSGDAAGERAGDGGRNSQDAGGLRAARGRAAQRAPRTTSASRQPWRYSKP